MHLGDQRAGRVQHRKLARRGFLLDAFRHTVSAENRHSVRRHFGQILDEAGALGLEALGHVLVVHDLVAHIDRRAVFLQRAFDDLDGAHNSGAKTTGLSEDYFHRQITSRPKAGLSVCGHGPQWCRATVFVAQSSSSIPGYFGKDSVTINPSPARSDSPEQDCRPKMTGTYDTNGGKCTPCPEFGTCSRPQRKHPGDTAPYRPRNRKISPISLLRHFRPSRVAIGWRMSHGCPDCRRWRGRTKDAEHSATILP